MSKSTKKGFLFRSCVIFLLIFFVLIIICVTAIPQTDYQSDIKATISKNDITEKINREEIAVKLVRIWMDKHKIGTQGWLAWIWTYEIEKVEFWGTDPSECVNIYVNIKTVFPSDFTLWNDLYSVTDGNWIKNGYTMVFHEDEKNYVLMGPYTLC